MKYFTTIKTEKRDIRGFSRTESRAVALFSVALLGMWFDKLCVVRDHCGSESEARRLFTHVMCLFVFVLFCRSKFQWWLMLVLRSCYCPARGCQEQ